MTNQTTTKKAPDWYKPAETCLDLQAPSANKDSIHKFAIHLSRFR